MNKTWLRAALASASIAAFGGTLSLLYAETGVNAAGPSGGSVTSNDAPAPTATPGRSTSSISGSSSGSSSARSTAPVRSTHRVTRGS